MAERFAVYYSPLPNSPLGAFGRSWLGRCAGDGSNVAQPSVEGVDPAELHALTRAPRHYGFHATLVAPFELADGMRLDDLLKETARAVRGWDPFALDDLSVVAMGSFLALAPSDQLLAGWLAERLLKRLHPLRRPPSLAELERRRARGLTTSQEQLLSRWGYPYVLDEYRFHMTLTGTVSDTGRRERLREIVANHTESLRRESHRVLDVCIFRQQDRSTPFTLVERIPFESGEGQA